MCSVEFCLLVVKGWYQSALRLSLGSASYYSSSTITSHDALQFDQTESLSRLVDDSAARKWWSSGIGNDDSRTGLSVMLDRAFCKAVTFLLSLCPSPTINTLHLLSKHDCEIIHSHMLSMLLNCLESSILDALPYHASGSCPTTNPTPVMPNVQRHARNPGTP